MKWIHLAIMGIFMSCACAAEPSFPRIMGMNIGAKNYDDPTYQDELSRADVVILGFYNSWRGKNGETIRDVVRALKQRNPGLLVGQYTILNEAVDPLDPRYADKDKGTKVDQENWWLTDKDGNRVKWTPYHAAWDVNITSWTQPDASGARYPQWLAERDYATYFGPIPEFDIWYFDLTVSKPPVKTADWNLDGTNDLATDPAIALAYRMGNAAEWQRARELHSSIYLMGNSSDLSSSEYRKKLQGVFLEALIGKSWSVEKWGGWSKMMNQYHNSMRRTVSPQLVGFNVWGQKNDYQRLRYGLTSCLLNNGYFAYTDENVEFSSVPWFDEYDVNLGQPVDPPQTVPWQNGIYRRLFQNGMVLVNPEPYYKYVILDPGYSRFLGTQAPAVNTGAPVTVIVLQPKDGIVLVKSAIN